jgi:hypothetical protein
LQIQNGDFSLGGARLGTVSAQQKLVQDLSHWFLEKMGTDSLHPGYGSLLDGGTKPNGQVVDSPIGDDSIDFVASAVEDEIRRIVAEYQQRQLQRAKDDRLRYNKTTLTPGEIIASLDDVGMELIQDKLRVTLFVTTAEGRNVTLDVPLPGSVIAR